LTQAVDLAPRRLVQGSADGLPFAAGSFDLVIAINVLHNLERARCVEALREIERVGRGASYVQVDSWLTGEQRESFAAWVLTALTYYDPAGWRELFESAGYRGDYYWTLTE
jgi:ubiquinone/menaquinone biosynthesis C-methylase UbiE